MSSYKADSRYTQRCDDVVECVSSASDDTSEESDTPARLARTKREWAKLYGDEVELLYVRYLEMGRALFGTAFHQLGGLAEFAEFVFKYIQPGAT